MRSIAGFKIPHDALENSCLFCVCYLLTAQYRSELRGIPNDTVLLNVLLLLDMVKY
jgi:hypothetical protein